jgi:lipopolysaccharide/colanic/teichoic acid biosynthesis glycosyltransferase
LVFWRVTPPEPGIDRDHPGEELHSIHGHDELFSHEHDDKHHLGDDTHRSELLFIPEAQSRQGRTATMEFPADKEMSYANAHPAITATESSWGAQPDHVHHNRAIGFVAPAQSIEQLVAEFAGPAEIALPRSYRVAKRALDISVAVTGLIISAPLFLIVAILVWLDSPGPVFFIQERVGYRGRTFRMLKFRTMVDNEPVRLTGGPHKQRGDRRVTRVGKLLRMTSLDELPQLVNVLRREMSLVGPRPEIVSIVLARYQPWQYQRFLVPQGMTGWWQVTGRGQKLLCEHTEDDIYYIKHASFWFDLKILLMTVRAVLRREGAF